MWMKLENIMLSKKWQSREHLRSCSPAYVVNLAQIYSYKKIQKKKEKEKGGEEVEGEKERVTKGYLLSDSIYMKCPELANL